MNAKIPERWYAYLVRSQGKHKGREETQLQRQEQLLCKRACLMGTAKGLGRSSPYLYNQLHVAVLKAEVSVSF